MTVDLTDTGCSKQAHGLELWVDELPQACSLCARPRCTARAKTRPGERCRQHPIPGGKTCRFHGSGTAAARASAAAALQERDAAAALGRLLLWNPDAAPVEDSVTEMRRLAGALGQAVNVLGGRLNGSVCEHCGRGPESLDGSTAAAWMRGIREQRTLLADMERLGIAGKALQLEADKVRLMAVAVGRMFDVLELSEEQRQVATAVLLKELRAEDDPEFDVVPGEVSP